MGSGSPEQADRPGDRVNEASFTSLAIPRFEIESGIKDFPLPNFFRAERESVFLSKLVSFSRG